MMGVNSSQSEQIETFADERPPLQFGAKRLYYQYSVAIPQAHLVLVSVLQGVVLGLLLQGLKVPSSSQNITFEALAQQYFYLPYIITSLIILLAWMDFVYASAVLIWPPSALQAALIFLLAVTEVIMINGITSAAAWVGGCGAVTIVGGLLRINNFRVFQVNDFEDAETGRTILRNELIYGLAYIALGSVGVAYGIGYRALMQVFPVGSSDAALHWISYASLSLDIVGILAIDVRYRQWLLRRLTRNTKLEVTRFGGVRHSAERPTTAEPPTAKVTAGVPATSENLG